MSFRTFWIAVLVALGVLLTGAKLLASPATFPPVTWTFVATFAGACAGALLLMLLRGSPSAMMAATLGRSVISVAGVVIVWLFLEPPAKPILGAFALGYLVFLILETALAYSLNKQS